MATQRIKLTDQAIKRINPPTEQGRQDEYYDAALPGLSLRVGTSGAKTFYLLYRYAGKVKRWKVGRYGEAFTLANAREKARQALADLETGRDPAAQAAQEKKKILEAPTVRQLKERYIEDYAKAHKASWAEDERILNKDVIPEWGELKAQDVKRRNVVELLRGIVRRGAPIAANRALAVIRRMYNFGLDEGLLDEDFINPAWRVKPPAPETPKERALREDEIKTFWKNLSAARMDEATKLALRLVLVTGQRPGEVIGMRLSELEPGMWTLPGSRTKNGLPHTVPLPCLAQELIQQAQALQPGESEFLFPSPRRKPNEPGKPMDERAMCRALSRNLEVLGVEKFTPHDLRRTAATMMGKMGISRFVQDRVLNHKDSTMGGVYDRHTYDREKRQALTAWASHLEQITSGSEPQSNVVTLNREAAQ